MTELIIGLCVIVVGVTIIAAYRDYRRVQKMRLYRVAEIIARQRIDYANETLYPMTKRERDVFLAAMAMATIKASKAYCLPKNRCSNDTL